MLGLIGGGVAVAMSRSGDDSEAVETAPTDVTEPAETSAGTEPPAVTEATAVVVTTAAPATTVDTTVVTTEPETTVTSLAPVDEVAGVPPGVKGDRASPVPAGAIADIGSGWRLQVLNVNPDAAAAVAAENPFNEPPPPGSTFALVTVALGYFGLEDPTSVFTTTISAIGTSSVELAAECGLIPQALDVFGDVFAGGVIVGNVCFVTTPADAAGLQLYATGDLFASEPVFLDARASPVGAVPMSALTGPQPGASSTPSRLAPTPLLGAADIGEGWRMAVGGAARDITDAVMAENSFNEPPPEGFRFIGVDVTYAYDGAGAGSVFSVTTKAVGSGNVELSWQCGVIPGEIDVSADVFAGGTVSGTVCFVVPASSSDLVVYATASFVGGSYVMFATS